ncbi:MAG: hypothetical protein ACR2IF_11820 [Terriglobales bacterium]
MWEVLKKTSAMVTLIAFLASPAAGFDTFWHSQASHRVGQEFGFSEDAWKIMQLGNFSPDLFGPVSQYVSEHLQGADLQKLSGYVSQNAASQGSAVFLHFDNLNGELSRDAQFDYLFAQLLQSTQKLLAGFGKQTGLDDRTRKVLVLITLGASLHAVQDFYSHSDWVHFDFNQTSVKLEESSGQKRAPTWFEFRAKYADPAKWPFQVTSGIYPALTDAANTHTHMNHDNSGLIYKEYENPGQPLRSEASYHAAGAVPAHEGDGASIAAHQQLAVNTAIAASIEWVRKVEENADAKAAIESAKGWNVKLDNAKLAKELQAGIAIQIGLSCAAGKWDGEQPPAERGALCKSVLERKLSAPASASQIEAEMIGLAAGLVMSKAMKFTGKFWDVYGQYHILEQLSAGLSSGAGHYKLQ